MTHDNLTWAKWWACPWLDSPHDWPPFTPSWPYSKTLCQSQHAAMATALGIAPCLPVEPSPALLQLVLEPAQRRDLILALVGGVYQIKTHTPLSQDLQLWCARLSKALMPNTLKISTEDPLHYLRAWVEPSVWQRLRLSFDRHRVLALEQTPRLSETHDKLETIWKAAIWRTGASNNEPVFSFAEESQDDAVQTHD